MSDILRLGQEIKELEEEQQALLQELTELAEHWEVTDWETQEANLRARDCATDLRELIETYE